jgi:hypothetical protein
MRNGEVADTINAGSISEEGLGKESESLSKIIAE